MATMWYYEEHGKRLGPISSAELRRLVVMEVLLPSDLVWREGLDHWVPASKVKGLFDVIPPAANSHSEHTPPPLPDAQPVAAEPGNGGAPPTQADTNDLVDCGFVGCWIRFLSWAAIK